MGPILFNWRWSSRGSPEGCSHVKRRVCVASPPRTDRTNHYILKMISLFVCNSPGLVSASTQAHGHRICLCLSLWALTRDLIVVAITRFGLFPNRCIPFRSGPQTTFRNGVPTMLFRIRSGGPDGGARREGQTGGPDAVEGQTGGPYRRTRRYVFCQNFVFNSSVRVCGLA